mmetsp:Transcript_28782/g.92452  ORF Transcript_28782/g.92452 Transcript_28782/m.92452 type:complete len:289 (-) Transcript_28782:584-1450(-)
MLPGAPRRWTSLKTNPLAAHVLRVPGQMATTMLCRLCPQEACPRSKSLLLRRHRRCPMSATVRPSAAFPTQGSKTPRRRRCRVGAGGALLLQMLWFPAGIASVCRSCNRQLQRRRTTRMRTTMMMKAQMRIPLTASPVRKRLRVESRDRPISPRHRWQRPLLMKWRTHGRSGALGSVRYSRGLGFLRSPALKRRMLRCVWPVGHWSGDLRSLQSLLFGERSLSWRGSSRSAQSPLRRPRCEPASRRLRRTSPSVLFFRTAQNSGKLLHRVALLHLPCCKSSACAGHVC